MVQITLFIVATTEKSESLPLTGLSLHLFIIPIHKEPGSTLVKTSMLNVTFVTSKDLLFPYKLCSKVKNRTVRKTL